MDEAVKGFDRIAHVAFQVSETYRPDLQVIIRRGIRFALSVLESATKEPSVKSVASERRSNNMNHRVLKGGK